MAERQENNSQEILVARKGTQHVGQLADGTDVNAGRRTLQTEGCLVVINRLSDFQIALDSVDPRMKYGY